VKDFAEVMQKIIIITVLNSIQLQLIIFNFLNILNLKLIKNLNNNINLIKNINALLIRLIIL